MVKRLNGKLIIKPEWIFNTYTVLTVRPHLDREIQEVEIDLSNVEIVDTDAIKFMFDVSESGISVSVKDPPDILFNILDMLGISDIFREKIYIT